MKINQKVKYFNKTAGKYFDGTVTRIDEVTYSFPVYIVLSTDGYERALTKSELIEVK